MHEMPINSKLFEEYIKKNGLFDKAREYLKEYLEIWWKEEPDFFLEFMEAPYEKVIKEYRFLDKIVSVEKNFSYEPPRDYLSVCISVRDEKNSYFGQYTVSLDFSFERIEDVLTM